ncbi:hypothetical protein J437_LFUL011261 [Ladona fulva]|uniref:Tetratricopeptide repeat protein 39C n=1 Tax=Ladona fulva TaxID=123851 RepID=A0A8K0P480_LADFU|nr:hypothetical protein J437_LFUL011261 [Ladona fulva]
MQTTDEENDWLLAKQGIKLLLNNKIDEAEQLFTMHKDNVQMAAGYCFVTFMNALMSFEEEKLQVSLQALKEMEKRCAQDIGWLKIMKNKVFGNGNSPGSNPAEHLEQQVILADSQVCVALLTFLQQDLSGYVKGGWVLRKAWKVYQHTYAQILQLYRKTFATEDVPGSQFPSWKVILKRPSNPNLLSPSSDWSVPSNGCSTATTPTSPMSGVLNGARSPLSIFASLGFQSEPSYDIPPSIVSRLMAAVSFGYGIFQLCISLLPPSLLRLIHFLGFEGDRQVGISALMFARQGQDMRAPLATCKNAQKECEENSKEPMQGLRQLLKGATWCCQKRPEEAVSCFRTCLVQRGALPIRSDPDDEENTVEEPQEDRHISAFALYELGSLLTRYPETIGRPSSSLALLWYHTIVRPFFALDGTNVRAGVEAAQHLIEESQEEYGSSALFLFFKGRVERLKSNISGALEAYEAAVQASAQREVQLLCLHEVGWCHLIHLSWLPAHASFLKLKQDSRWSKSFYAYLASVCAGASGNLERALALAREVPNLASQQRNTQLENFILKRVRRFPPPSNGPLNHANDAEEAQERMLDRHQCTLLAFELLFLWNALPSCSQEGLDYILQEKTLEEGKCLLLQAQNNYTGYDFENRLTVRIHAALRNIG